MKILFVAAVTLLLAGGDLSSGGCQATGGDLTFRVLADSQVWGLRKEEPAYVVVTEKNWRSYYAVLPPGADLANNIYMVAYWGARPNPGYRISIMALRQVGGVVQVAVNLEEPDPVKFYVQVIVYPVAVAEVSKKSVPAGAVTLQFMDQKGNPLARAEVEI